MSLRFLTRRRDRDRDRSTNASSSFDTKPSSSRIGKVRSAVPAEVQIISWDPDHLETSGRDVHIRSRADTTTSTSTPVYHAFTTRPSSLTSARRGSDVLTPPEAASSSSSHSSIDHIASNRTNIDAQNARKARPRTAPRSYDHQWQGNSQSFFDGSPATKPASTWVDTPRSEDVEVLEPTWPSPSAATEEKSRPQCNLPDGLKAKARRVNSRSSHSTSAGYDAFMNTEDSNTTCYSGMPSSLPSDSRSPFASIQRNASVASLASLFSLGGSGSKDTAALASSAEMTRSASSTSNTLLSRIPSSRRLRRSKNASSTDMQFFASPSPSKSGAEASEMVASRSRSSSLSSLTPKFLRTRDAQAASMSASKSRPLRGAPPSAWKSDMAGTAAADGASSACSSDNEGSSYGQAQESGSTLGHLLNKVAVSAHVRKSSADATSKHTSLQLLHPSSHNIEAASPRSPASFSSRPLDTETSSPLLASSITAVDSPIISGLPLPETTSASISSLFTTQLFKRLGPPPVGLEPHCFEDRVSLILSYIHSQVPPPPCPKSPPLGWVSQRSSLPPPTTMMREAASVAVLEDEFDKLECLAEMEMAKLVLGGGGVSLGELRLEEVFVEARRRSGVDWSRSHFELSSLVTAGGGAGGSGSPRMRDGGSAANAGMGGSGLGLGLVNKGQNGVGGLGVSLKPAPRSRRRPVTASGSAASEASGKRPTTAPETQLPEERFAEQITAGNARSGSVLRTTEAEAGLFTPQSFSSTTIRHLHSPLPSQSANTPPPSSYNKLRRGSSDHDSSSSHTHSNSSASKSPLFWTAAARYAGASYHTEEDTEDTASCESARFKVDVGW